MPCGSLWSPCAPWPRKISSKSRSRKDLQINSQRSKKKETRDQQHWMLEIRTHHCLGKRMMPSYRVCSKKLTRRRVAKFRARQMRSSKGLTTMRNLSSVTWSSRTKQIHSLSTSRSVLSKILCFFQFSRKSTAKHYAYKITSSVKDSVKALQRLANT